MNRGPSLVVRQNGEAILRVASSGGNSPGIAVVGQTPTIPLRSGEFLATIRLLDLSVGNWVMLWGPREGPPPPDVLDGAYPL